MKVSLLCFGITKDIVGSFQTSIELPEHANVSTLKEVLNKQYPAFSKLVSLRVAIREEYAEDDTLIQPNDEVVLVPPVSGG